LLHVALSLGVLGGLDVARAETVPPPSEGLVEEAKRVYEEAATAYDARRYGEAIHLFQRADRLKPNPAFDFNIGLAYEDMGDPARALARTVLTSGAPPTRPIAWRWMRGFRGSSRRSGVLGFSRSQ
jgi:hypothetical protein